MDKQRHPNVVRTWTVERTKVRCPSRPPAKLRTQIREGSVPGAGEQSDPPAPATQGGPVDTAHTGMIHR